MSSTFSVWDYVVFIVYATIILSVGLFVSRNKGGKKKTTEDYFLASKALPWWAIGASLIAANISAEQFIGMSGSGFVSGLAIASYEWMAALTLLIVGKFFLPVFIKRKLYTIPEFIEQRYSTNLKSILAIFWIALYVFVNLTSVLYLGGLALETVLGVDSIYAIIGLALFAAAYSLYGGLSAVAWTDMIQVVFLVIGGIVTTYIALNIVGGDAGGVLAGAQRIYEEAPGHFDLILDKSNPEYNNLPGIGVLVGGMWIANLYYWGFNQYIIQRTLAAKSLEESQKGILFAAFLKMIIPFIVVIPGIAAYVIVNDPELLASVRDLGNTGVPSKNDDAYPWLMQLLPVGLKGVSVAALAAAVVSSLASMLNSTSTIFTMDLYKPYIAKNGNEQNLVRVGRISAAVALVLAVVMAPLLGSIDQAFQFIQEYTGIVSPGILAVFMLGLFWPRTSNRAAIAGALFSIPVAMYFKVGPKGWLEGGGMEGLFVELPFLTQMGLTFVITSVFMMFFSYVENRSGKDKNALVIEKGYFKTSPMYNIGAFIILILLSVIYALFW